MPEGNVRLEIALRSGQTLAVNVAQAVVDEIEKALQSGDSDSLSFEAEDGRYTVVVRTITFLKQPSRESRVGFGVGA